MARKLEIEIVGDSRSFQRALGQATGSGSRFGSMMGRLGKAALVTGAALAGGLVVAGVKSAQSLARIERIGAQTNAVIESTGGAANVTRKHVDKLAGTLERLTSVEAEAITEGQNLLLTFTSIQNRVGEGNNVFDQATEIMTDMSVALGQDMSSSAIQLGKALNDPVRGMTALRRVGVSFTDQQVDMVKKLIESGDELGAQKLILQELRKEFGGSARALGQTFGGRLEIVKHRLGEFGETIVAKVFPALEGGLDRAEDFMDFLGRVSDAPDISVALKIVWTGVKDVAGDLYKALEKALMGGTTRTPLRLDSGQIIEWKTTRQVGLVESIEAGLRGMDWSMIGQRIGDGISRSIRVSADFIKSVLTGANAFIEAHMDEFADLGARMMLTIISKLLDPSFWARNWQLILGIAVAVFPITKVLGLGFKIAGALLGPIARLLPAGFLRIGGRAVDAILGVLGRLPGLVQRIIVTVVSGALRALSRLVSWIGGTFRAVLDRIPGWVKAAFRLGSVLAFINAVQAVINKVGELIGWIRSIPSIGGSGSGHPRIPGRDLSGVRAPGRNAMGTNNWRGGLSWVGERGPELLNLPRGSQVIPNHRVAAAGAGGRVEVIVVGGNQAGIDWIRQLNQNYRRTNGGQGLLDG